MKRVVSTASLVRGEREGIYRGNEATISGRRLIGLICLNKSRGARECRLGFGIRRAHENDGSRSIPVTLPWAVGVI